ncbi:MAG TPA: hypothetical protein P5522_09910 [Spirochaetia bacterium]|nr:hypothetical protein [Spirochaetia bacterium]
MAPRSTKTPGTKALRYPEDDTWYRRDGANPTPGTELVNILIVKRKQNRHGRKTT